MVMAIPKKVHPTTLNVEKTRIFRRGGIRIKVSEDIEVRLEAISKRLGVPPSTLAAVAVGSWVSQQESSLNMASQVGQALSEQFGKLLSQLADSQPDLHEELAGDA